MNQKELAPFSCSFTPNLPELLTKLDCTLVITTFQAGKVVFISPKDEEHLVQLPRTFHRPMGLALKEDKMAIATQSEVLILRDSKTLAASYKDKPDLYDALYMPRASYFTGPIDIHDLHWGAQGLYAVNTSFSCLCMIDEQYSFTPIWQPSFISELKGDDRCHLNGLAMSQDKPKYISALGSNDFGHSWREDITRGGVIIDIDSKEVIARNLAMPHSPRIYDNKLYVLLSAQEKLVCIDIDKGTSEDVAFIGGFVRGMCRLGDFLFIGTSKLRKNSSAFQDLEIANKADVASVTILHLPTATIMAKLTYHSSVDEIYDIQVIPEVKRPNIINTLKGDHHRAVHLPGAATWASTPEEKQSPTPESPKV